MTDRPTIQVTVLPVGALQANCVIVNAEGQQECLVIDSGDEPGTIIAQLMQRELTPAAFLQTHCHGDHIGALTAMKQRFPDVPLVVHEAEREFLTRSMLNLSMLMGTTITAPEADRLVADGDTVDAGVLHLTALHVPGHSPGSIAWYVAPEHGGPLLFSGDILFAGGIGRTDFPGGSMRQLEQGILEKLYVLPGETQVFPGHGPATTIEQERQNNPFIRI